MVKSFGAEEIESNRFRDRAEKLRNSNLRYVVQQAIASPVIEFFGAVTMVALLGYVRAANQSRLHDYRRVHQLRDRAADAVRAGQAAERHPQYLSAGAGRVAEGVRISGSRSEREGKAGRGKTRALRDGRSISTMSVSAIRACRMGSCWTRSTRGKARAGGGAGGVERRGKDHAGESGAAVL